MAIQVGDKVPDIELQLARPEGPEAVRTGELFAGKKTVLFAVPGAFTPVCSAQHLPGFIDKAAEISAKGVDQIACLSVNDAFVMDAWALDKGARNKLIMLADGSAAFTRALGLELDASSFGMGIRSQRFAAVIEDGMVTALHVEASPVKVEASSAEAILAAL